MKELLCSLLGLAVEKVEEVKRGRTKEEIVEYMDKEFVEAGEVCDAECRCAGCAIKISTLYRVQDKVDLSDDSVQEQQNYMYTKYEILRGIDNAEEELSKALENEGFRTAVENYYEAMARKRLFQVGEGTWKAPSKEESENNEEENVNEENEVNEDVETKE